MSNITTTDLRIPLSEVKKKSLSIIRQRGPIMARQIRKEIGLHKNNKQLCDALCILQEAGKIKADRVNQKWTLV